MTLYPLACWLCSQRLPIAVLANTVIRFNEYVHVPTPLHVTLCSVEDEVWDSLAVACPVPGTELPSDECKETGVWARPMEQQGLLPVGSMWTMAVD